MASNDPSVLSLSDNPLVLSLSDDPSVLSLSDPLVLLSELMEESESLLGQDVVPVNEDESLEDVQGENSSSELSPELSKESTSDGGSETEDITQPLSALKLKS